MKTTSFLFVIVASFWLSQGRAHAGGDFNVPGIACIPDPAAVAANRYVSGTRIQHNGSNVDLITLYCPVSGTIDPPTHLWMMYVDNDAFGGTYVSASYIKMNKGTGAITTIATATSQNGVQGDTFVHTKEVPVSDAYDLVNYVFYVRVDIDRLSTTNLAAFYQVTLW